MTLALILSTAVEEDRGGEGKPGGGRQDEEHAVASTPATASRGTQRREYELAAPGSSGDKGSEERGCQRRAIGGGSVSLQWEPAASRCLD
jgi:hypothetical protein